MTKSEGSMLMLYLNSSFMAPEVEWNRATS